MCIMKPYKNWKTNSYLIMVPKYMFGKGNKIIFDIPRHFVSRHGNIHEIV